MVAYLHARLLDAGTIAQGGARRQDPRPVSGIPCSGSNQGSDTSSPLSIERCGGAGVSTSGPWTRTSRLAFAASTAASSRRCSRSSTETTCWCSNSSAAFGIRQLSYGEPSTSWARTRSTTCPTLSASVWVERTPGQLTDTVTKEARQIPARRDEVEGPCSRGRPEPVAIVQRARPRPHIVGSRGVEAARGDRRRDERRVGHRPPIRPSSLSRMTTITAQAEVGGRDGNYTAGAGTHVTRSWDGGLRLRRGGFAKRSQHALE